MPKTKEAFVTALQKCIAEICGCKIAVEDSFGAETKAACRLDTKEDMGLFISIL